MNNTRFPMPTAPKNGLDLLRWVIFEPILLEKFSKNLSPKEAWLWFLKIYPWTTLWTLLLYFSGFGVIAAFRLPSLLPQCYKLEFLTQLHLPIQKVSLFIWLVTENIGWVLGVLFLNLFLFLDFEGSRISELKNIILIELVGVLIGVLLGGLVGGIDTGIGVFVSTTTVVTLFLFGDFLDCQVVFYLLKHPLK